MQKLIENFRSQLNLVVSTIYDVVGHKWNVDAHNQQFYKAREKAEDKIYRSHRGSYSCLWDYCATLRDMNKGSCILVKAEMIDR